jgi:hypothetical protein
MRKGVVVFLAGIGLLCTGIVATSDGFWGKQDRTGKIPIEIGDATIVDLRGIGGALQVRFSDAEQPGLHDLMIPAGGAGGIAERLIVDRHGSTLRLAPKGEQFYGAKLVLPSKITRVVAENGRFEGSAPSQTLRIEASGIVNWKGDADALTLVSVAKPSRRKRPSCRDDAGCVQSTFSIEDGSIRTLAIESRNGNIQLGDIGGVGTIDLDVGPEAGLRVAHVADLARIHIHDLDEAPAPSSSP